MHYGPPLSAYAKKLMILGAGELGKEVIIEAQRLGLETIAVDRYAHAPAMALAHRHHVIDMTDPGALRSLLDQEQPDWVVPEIEALATAVLVQWEDAGHCVVPTAKAVQLTMDREGIRRLACERLHLTTPHYAFCDSLNALQEAAATLGWPLVVKPLMSSSGKGQSVCRTPADLELAWHIATHGGRVASSRIIAEEWIGFDAEVTLLTVRCASGTIICPPIGHRQEEGDYVESWQPHDLSAAVMDTAESIARTITGALGGYGLYGVELFIRDETVYFSEVSPRPHDTGMVTLVSQDLSEFALHVRAILGLDIAPVTLRTAAASRAIKAQDYDGMYVWEGLEAASRVTGTTLRLFGKPKATPGRRLGVVLSRGENVGQARRRTQAARDALSAVPTGAQTTR